MEIDRGRGRPGVGERDRSESVAGAGGRSFDVTYSTGVRHIVVPPNVPIVQITPGDRSMLKPGAKVFLIAIKTPSDKDDMVADIARRTAISQNQGRNLFTVTFSDRSPEVSQRVVQSLLSIFVESNVGASRTDIEKARQFLDVQIAQYEKSIQSAFREVADGLAARGTYDEQIAALGRLDRLMLGENLRPCVARDGEEFECQLPITVDLIGHQPVEPAPVDLARREVVHQPCQIIGEPRRHLRQNVRRGRRDHNKVSAA